MTTPEIAERARQAAQAIAGADALFIGAGAGMGVDSGLPDFRGNQGFWRAYPVYEKLKLDFAQMASPRWFRVDPEMAWGFYGHRLELYRKTRPHDGFEVLLSWARQLSGGAFVFTSNVDGQFQRAGFAPDQIIEVHGSIDWMQCTERCEGEIFSAEPHHLSVDPETFRARPPLPACPRCGVICRPNVLMFGDAAWDSARTDLQEERMRRFLDAVKKGKLVVIECGAGTAIPTVRSFCEGVARSFEARLIRINPRDFGVPERGISFPMGSLEGLLAIDAALHDLG